MSDTLTAWLAERRRIHGAATEGPWETYGNMTDSGTPFTVVELSDDKVIDLMWLEGSALDGLAIVDAHNVAVPALLAAVEAVLNIYTRDEEREGSLAEAGFDSAVEEMRRAICDALGVGEGE